MKLVIDTSLFDETRIAFLEPGGIEVEKRIHRQPRSQVLLKAIRELSGESKIKITDIDEIELSTGPGSFTGLRVGASIANALGYCLNIPVNSKKMETNLSYS